MFWRIFVRQQDASQVDVVPREGTEQAVAYQQY